ncbi:MAG: thioredoxin domain-containing protein [Deinococcota bacterium]|nr:thioredoxin domain-containing protein [Deinococcota bacterium]
MKQPDNQPNNHHKPNRLSGESSPYLLQHAHNPVDWYPWGEEAFERARQEDKPVLLSVGYSACHWCHVMAHESFEDEVTAAQMNKDFINIKVDREERPDVDAIYMNAVQAMTGQGGWPMTVAMTPDGKPFYGGTYFPPEDRYGRPGFKSLLSGLSDAWRTRRDEVMQSADGMTEHLKKLSDFRAAEGEFSPAVLDDALAALQRHFDAKHGGFGGAPKFPPHQVLNFLLRSFKRTGRAEALRMAEVTLEKMARGGLYDQIGGGFARYSVDERWLVPHFEKMLYDNAQLVQRYLEAYQLSGRSYYREVAEETLDWVLREMRDPSGGFYSALDADSEGEEGKFYVWTDEELEETLGEDAPLARAYYGVSSAGNFEGKSILYLPREPQDIAERFGLSQEGLAARLKAINQTLLKERDKRVRPGLDDKILCSWNGLMLAAFADAGRILDRQDYLEVATKNAAFVEERMVEGGRLRHVYKEGKATVAGLLEDYAYYGTGLMALYRASFTSRWLDFALELAEVMVRHFADEENGGFYSTADDAEALIVRPKDYFDGAVPSGIGSASELLLVLARYTGNRHWEAMAARSLTPMLAAMRQQPNGFGLMLANVDRLLSAPQEIAVFGDKDGEDTRRLLRAINRHYLPNAALALAEGAGSPVVERLPFLQGRDRIAGKATVYVCEGGACKLPVTSPEELEDQLTS